MRKKMNALILTLIFLLPGIGLLGASEPHQSEEPGRVEEIANGHLALDIGSIEEDFQRDNLPEVDFPGSESVPQKLGYNYGIEDATGQGNVRASAVKMGVEYKVTEKSSLGIEASKEVHDSRDAAAWGKSVKDETAAGVKYKVSF